MTDTAGDVFPINVFLFLPNVSQSTGYQMKQFQTSFKIKKKYKQHEAQRKHKENMAEVHVNTVVAQCEKI